MNDLYTTYTALAAAANVKAKAKSSFKSKAVLQAAIDALPKPEPKPVAKGNRKWEAVEGETRNQAKARRAKLRKAAKAAALKV